MPPFQHGFFLRSLFPLSKGKEHTTVWSLTYHIQSSLYYLSYQLSTGSAVIFSSSLSQIVEIQYVKTGASDTVRSVRFGFLQIFFRLSVCALCQSSVQNEKARDTWGSATSTFWVQYLHTDCHHVKDQNNRKSLCSKGSFQLTMPFWCFTKRTWEQPPSQNMSDF